MTQIASSLLHSRTDKAGVFSSNHPIYARETLTATYSTDHSTTSTPPQPLLHIAPAQTLIDGDARGERWGWRRSRRLPGMETLAVSTGTETLATTAARARGDQASSSYQASVSVRISLPPPPHPQPPCCLDMEFL
jgi:hypothetical protein